MRLIGYCTGCRRIKYVRVSGHQLAMMAARGSGVAEGICDDCEKPEGRR
jgi:hypothetical protein